MWVFTKVFLKLELQSLHLLESQEKSPKFTCRHRFLSLSGLHPPHLSTCPQPQLYVTGTEQCPFLSIVDFVLMGKGFKVFP